MKKNVSPDTPDAAAAIDDVLVAETATRQAMEACRQEAEDVLEAAREDARHINRLANRRISNLHTRCDALVSRRIDVIRAEAREDAVRTELNAADRELLATAVGRVAARLTQAGNG